MIDDLRETYSKEFRFFDKYNIKFNIKQHNGYYIVDLLKANQRVYSFKATVVDIETIIELLYRLLTKLL